MRTTYRISIATLLATLATPLASAAAAPPTAPAQRPQVSFGFGVQFRAGDDRRRPPERGRIDVAFNRGFDDGYVEGLRDGRSRHRDDPFAESRYRSGDHGFDWRYGNRVMYRERYRDGFVSGYERGYREGWRPRGWGWER